MNLADTCAWLEYFGNGSNASDYAAVLEKTDSLLVPTICIQEVYRHYLAWRSESDARLAVARMRRSKVVPHDQDLGILAAKLGHQYKLALADSIVYASALIHQAPLWTQDSAFKGLPLVEYRVKKKTKSGS